MNLIRTRRVLLLLLVGWGLGLSACRGGGAPPTVVPGVDRSDPTAVAQASFRAIMAKDYRQLRQLVGCGAAIPEEKLWMDASFLRDRTANENIKQAWEKESLGGYTVDEVTMEDFQGPRFLPEKLVQVHFSLSGESYAATFPITLCDNQWSPGTNPSLRDFIVRFEEPG